MRGTHRLLIVAVAVELIMALSLVSGAAPARSSPGSALARQAVQASAQLAGDRAPAVSVGRLLYTAGGSRGFSGWKTWDGQPLSAKYWRVTRGQLLSTGVDSAYVKAPYEPGKHQIANYAVEAQIRVLSLNKALNPPHGFGLLARGSPYPQYIIAYQTSLVADQTPRPEIWFLGGVSTGQITSKQFVRFDPMVWHTYREEVVGKQIRYLIDGVVVLKGVAESLKGGGYVGLGYGGTQIAVRSFKVVALGSVSGATPACGTHCGTGAVLYRTTWPQGVHSLLDWSVEAGEPSGWDIKGGMLVTDGNGSGGIVQPDFSPADLGIKDYAVEAQIKVQSLATVDNPNYGLRVRVVNGRPEWGYGGSLTFRQDKLSGLVDSSIFCEAGPSTGWMGGKRFVLMDATRWHTYRFEVAGSRMQYLIDGVVVAAGTSEYWKEGGFGALRFAGVKMAVRSFTVTSLAGSTLPKAVPCGEQCGSAGTYYASSAFSMHNLLGWTLVSGDAGYWHLEGGQVVHRSTDIASLIKPDYEPGPWGHANYAVEARIQVRDVQKDWPIRAVALLARASDRFGYAVELRLNGPNWDANIWQRGGSNLGYKASVLKYVPGAWYTLRMEVNGGTIRFLIDGTVVLQATDEHPITDGGWVGVQPTGTQIALRNFTISAL